MGKVVLQSKIEDTNKCDRSNCHCRRACGSWPLGLRWIERRVDDDRDETGSRELAPRDIGRLDIDAGENYRFNASVAHAASRLSTVIGCQQGARRDRAHLALYGYHRGRVL